MAFSWVGLSDYVDWADEKQTAKKKAMDEKEALMFSLAGKYGVDFLGDGANTTLAGASATTEGFNQAVNSKLGSDAKSLIETYGITEEALVPIMATGDKTSLKRLLEILDTQNQKYGSEAKIMPKEAIAQIVESAVLTQPSGKKINFGKMEEYIGREMDDMYKTILTIQNTKAGEVYYPTPTYAKSPTMAEIGEFQKLAMSSNVNRGAFEKGRVQKQLAKLVKLQESGNLSVNKQAELSWLTERFQTIGEALDSYEEGIYVPAAELYGTEYFNQMLENKPRFKKSDFDPILFDTEVKMMTVPNKEVAESLEAAGILRPGDVVYNLSTNMKIKVIRPEER